jgi:hypothetical protein
MSIELKSHNNPTIESEYERLGKSGEQKFWDNLAYCLPAITGLEFRDHMMQPKRFEVKDVTHLHTYFDFILVDKDGSTILTEVKTRNKVYFRNAIVELGLIREFDSFGQCLHNWFEKKKADRYVFVHMTEDRRKSQFAVISIGDLERCVTAGGNMRCRHMGYHCLQIPIKRLKEFGAKMVYSREFISTDPPSDPFLVQLKDGSKKVLFHNLYPEYVNEGTPGLEQRDC